MSSQSSLRCNVLLPQHILSWLLILSRLSYTFLLSYTRQARVVQRNHWYVVVYLHPGNGYLRQFSLGALGPSVSLRNFAALHYRVSSFCCHLTCIRAFFAAALPVIIDPGPTGQRHTASFVRGVHFFGVLCALFHWSLQGFSNKRALPRSWSSLFVAGIADLLSE